MEEIEEYKEIVDSLHKSLQDRVKDLLSNFRINQEEFADSYRTFEYNLQN